MRWVQALTLALSQLLREDSAESTGPMEPKALGSAPTSQLALCDFSQSQLVPKVSLSGHFGPRLTSLLLTGSAYRAHKPRLQGTGRGGQVLNDGDLFNCLLSTASVPRGWERHQKPPADSQTSLSAEEAEAGGDTPRS